MKSLTTPLIVIVLCLNTFPVEAARPTLRVLRSRATNMEEVRRSTYGQKAPQYETFLNKMLGFSVQYPKDWESSYVTAKSLADAIIYFAPASNVRSTLSVWVKEKTANTYEDLEKDFARFARQPINDYQTETMSHIHELKNAEHKQVQWNGQSVLLSTFEAGGVQDPYKYRQVRIPAGTRLYTLTFAATEKNFESEVYRFDPFLASFTTFIQQTQEKAEPTRSDRRSRVTGARSNRAPSVIQEGDEVQQGVPSGAQSRAQERRRSRLRQR